MDKKVVVYHVFPDNKEGKTIARVVANIFGLVISGIRIMSGIQGTTFVAFPSYKAPNGQYWDTVSIEDTMLDREVKEEILRQYNAKIDFNPFLPIFADDKPETNKK